MSREPSRERPILFSSPMVRAIIAGTKTQTRRVAKIDDVANGKPVQWVSVAPCTTGIMEVRCPYGEPGDRLWVRETFCTMIVNDWPNPVGPIGYRADGNLEHNPGCWRPSIHMARRHSRITLEITGVRVERLQDISEAEAIAEGIEPRGEEWRNYGDSMAPCIRPRTSFATLWASINGPGSWDANPWVWVIEFRRVQ